MSGVLVQCAVLDTSVSLFNQHLGNLEACPVIESDAFGTKLLNHICNIPSFCFYGMTTFSNFLKEVLIFGSRNQRVSFSQKPVKIDHLTLDPCYNNLTLDPCYNNKGTFRRL